MYVDDAPTRKSPTTQPLDISMLGPSSAVRKSHLRSPKLIWTVLLSSLVLASLHPTRPPL